MNPLTLALALAFAAPDDCGEWVCTFGTSAQVTADTWKAWHGKFGGEWFVCQTYRVRVRTLQHRDDAGITLGVSVDDRLAVTVYAGWFGWIPQVGYWTWGERSATRKLWGPLVELHP